MERLWKERWLQGWDRQDAFLVPGAGRGRGCSYPCGGWWRQEEFLVLAVMLGEAGGVPCSALGALPRESPGPAPAPGAAPVLGGAVGAPQRSQSVQPQVRVGG